ncbi:MAG: RdgB/HAM1 family non-canonical purine NTP pyrophosphatase [Candidatus Micrarchaeota archaeon]
MELLFATSNAHKFEEASAMLLARGIKLRRLPFEHREIRSDSLEEIAREAVDAAFRKCGKPVFVEDTGLFVEALDGFPGTYSGWALKKIGYQGLLKLLSGVDERSAYFEACIAYHDGNGVSVFRGRCDGAITEEPAGDGGFGFDPVFVPSGHSQTFAQNIPLKNKLSHRYKSLLEFSKSLYS